MEQPAVSSKEDVTDVRHHVQENHRRRCSAGNNRGGIAGIFHGKSDHRIFTFLPERTNFSGIVQGIFIGVALAYITTNLILDDEVKAIQTTTNGWNTIMQCNVPGNGSPLRAVCAKVLPAANVAQEAAYWPTTVDSTGRAPSGMTQISSPNDSVLVIGRVLVYSDGDLPIAYGLAKQIQLTPLSQSDEITI